jgi:restriction endonuclease Mrr
LIADITFHYPPELMSLLIDTIPLLNRSKRDVFLFFRGAGVNTSLIQNPWAQWSRDKDSINKYEITRQILTTLNEHGELCLRERREVLRRVVEFENYSSCWAADQLKAKGLVSEIQKIVNVKDSFTRMAQERESERRQRAADVQAKRDAARKKREQVAEVKGELFALFGMENQQKRGKALEAVLNRLFQTYGISVREDFVVRSGDGDGVVEQIDGVIEIDGELYFVEMKWWSKPLGVPEVSQHLPRIMFRSEARAIVISASEFTAPAVLLCKDALQQKVVVLCTLQELVILLEQNDDLVDFIKKKARAAITDRNPFMRYLGRSDG